MGSPGQDDTWGSSTRLDGTGEASFYVYCVKLKLELMKPEINTIDSGLPLACCFGFLWSDRSFKPAFQAIRQAKKKCFILKGLAA